MLKKLSILVLSLSAGLSALGQSLTLTGPTNVKPGQTGVVINLNLVGSATAHISAFQVTITPSANFTITSSAAGPATTAAMKTFYPSPGTWTNTSPGIALFAGLNQTDFADGVILTLTGTVAANTTSPLIFSLSSSFAASDAAKSLQVTLTSGANLSLSIISPCDINADGVINVADIQAYLNSYVFTAQPIGVACAGDLTGDGVCNVYDIQRIATAGTTGGACVIGQ